MAEELTQMGFTDAATTRRAVIAANGDLKAAVKDLITLERQAR